MKKEKIINKTNDKKKKAFTLVELLAVIVILAVIILIAVTAILPQMKKSRENAFVDVVYQYLRAVQTNTVTDGTAGEYAMYNFPGDTIEGISKQPENGYIIKNVSDKYKLAFWDDKTKTCAIKDFNDGTVTINKSAKTSGACTNLVQTITADSNITVESLTGIPSKVTIDGVEQDAVLKPECYTFDDNKNVTDFDTAKCGSVVVIPNQVDDKVIAGLNTSLSNENIKAFYMSGAENVKTLPNGFLQKAANLETIYISNLPNLNEIPSSFANNNSKLKQINISNLPNVTIVNSGSLTDIPNANVVISNLPKLEEISSASGNIGSLSLVNLPELTSVPRTYSNVKNIKISNCKNIENLFNNNLYIETFNTDTLPLVTSLSQDFNRSTFETFDFDKLPGLVSITQSFDNSNLKEVYISNHKKLSSINTGTFGNCKNLKNITLNNNDQLTKINYAFKYSTNIETLVISNNDNLTTISGSFTGNPNMDIVIDNNAKLGVDSSFNLTYQGTYDKYIFRNSKNITNIKNISLDASFNVLDLSGTAIDSLPESSFVYSANNVVIKELVLPTTIKSVNSNAFKNATVEKVYAAGEDKCALNSLLNGKVSTSALPVCN